MKRSFSTLSAREILALAIAREEDDARLLGECARQLRGDYPAAATAIDAMRHEEEQHRHRLLEQFQQNFGDEVPLLRREQVKGLVARERWVGGLTTSPSKVREYVGLMEIETERFYERAAAVTTDAQTRQLLSDLATEERRHETMAQSLARNGQSDDERENEHATERYLFVLQVMQPGLAGLMNGSVSTVAPLFAAAFATKSSWPTFLVGLAAAVGAGISMGFAEALSDDGSLTRRGRPWQRGVVCGARALAGRLGHALRYLIPHFMTATIVATMVVLAELLVIAWIRNRCMETPFFTAALQVIFGGLLVFAAGVLIGSS